MGGYAAGRVGISVPSSSGKSLQLLPNCCPMSWSIISVPSSSGKSLQRLAIARVTRRHNLFQSPLHRGNHFNSVSAPSATVLENISVPSSSGKSLQQNAKLKEGLKKLEFQSPLHRGNHFNPEHQRAVLRRYLDFSPLFIGEITST